MAGVLSRGVEYSSIGARPLVRVYSPRQMRELMRHAGFADVTTTVRHFQPTDTPVTYVLRRWVKALEDPDVLDRIGRIGGWYVVATGTKPGTPAVAAVAPRALELARKALTKPPRVVLRRALGGGDGADGALPRAGAGAAARRARAARSARRRLARRLLGAAPAHARSSSPTSTPEELERVAPGERERVLAARRARGRRGSSTSSALGRSGSARPADWHTDVVSGTTWPPAWWRDARVRAARPAERREGAVGDLAPAVAAAGRPGVPARRRRAPRAGRPRHARRVDRGEPVRRERQLGEPDGGGAPHPHLHLALPRARRQRGVARPRLPAPLPARASTSTATSSRATSSSPT